jgi:hypothetical protein
MNRIKEGIALPQQWDQYQFLYFEGCVKSVCLRPYQRLVYTDVRETRELSIRNGNVKLHITPSILSPLFTDEQIMTTGYEQLLDLAFGSARNEFRALL